MLLLLAGVDVLPGVDERLRGGGDLGRAGQHGQGGGRWLGSLLGLDVPVLDVSLQIALGEVRSSAREYLK